MALKETKTTTKKTTKEKVEKSKKTSTKKPQNTAKKTGLKLVGGVDTGKTLIKKIAMSGKQVELPKNYAPSEKEEYMNENQLEFFRQKLLGWKKELLSECSETLNHLQTESWNEPDPSDQATIVEQTGIELRTRDRYRKLIGKIDSAVQRIESGEYGYCDITGEPIGIRRLEARPIATMTIAAQEQHEDEERVSVED